MPDLVNCAHSAEGAAEIERIYELGDLHRLKDLLADARGSVLARFAFKTLAGRPTAKVTVRATPILVCQRCMQGFALPVDGGSQIEFASAGEFQAADSEREVFEMTDGLVSLRELAEEELLLALPIVPACSTPETCGRAPGHATDELSGAPDEMQRPFGSLQDLLKKT